MFRDWTRAGLLALLALGAPPVWADRLVIVGAPASTGLGGVSSAFSVQRQLDSGTPILTGSLNVTLASSSGRGQFGADPSVTAVWMAGLSIAIADGQSGTVPLYYRDGAPGSALLSAQAAGFTTGTATVAVGTRIVTDTVETGTLYVTDVPPGAWNTNWLPEPGNPVTATPAALHRGSWGLRVDDTVGSGGAGGQNAVFFDTAPMAGDLYLRTWVRLTFGNSQGNIILAQLTNGGAVSPSLIDFRIDIPTRQIEIAGFDNVPAYFQENADAGITPGAWHLVELATLGVGTDAGARRVWLDGQPIYALDGIAWGGGAYDVARVTLGEPYAADRRFRGQLDFDDTAAAAQPLPSRLVLTAPSSPLAAGACGAVSVALFASTGAGPLPSPYAFSGFVTATAGAAIYSDSMCLTPASTFSLGAGATAGKVFVMAGAPTTAVQVEASYIDYLPGSATFSVGDGAADAGAADAGTGDAGTTDAGTGDAGTTDAGVADGGANDAGAADGGSAGPPLSLSVGCSCGSVGLSPTLFVLLLAWRRRRVR